MQRENPFPGVNPWMQGVWSDMHTMLIGYIRDALGSELPDDLMARAEENGSLRDAGTETSSRPDVAVIESESWKHGESPVWTPEDDPQLADRVAKPVLVQIENITPRWVEIRSANGNLVTVIGVTSPANKSKEGRFAFEGKVRSLLRGGVNVMEIDLIRGGISSRDCHPGAWPSSPCSVVVNRRDRSDLSEVYPCPLRESLPAVRVPLRSGEKDAALDLQPLINRCYTNGRYWMLPYHEEAVPTLSDSDREWAKAILVAAGLREQS